MSTWRFILISRSGVRTVVPEPLNWQNPEVAISRETENGWHGIFFDYGVGKLQFEGLGASLLKEEYDENGVNGQMTIDIQFQCAEDNLYDNFYEGGRVAFDQYSDTCGDECTVTVGIEDSNGIMLFRNNYEQSVDLNSNIAFDQTTILADYTWLNKDMEIPNRGLPQTVGGNSPGESHSTYPIEVRLTTPIFGTQIRVRPELTENSVSEIADSDPGGSSSYMVFPQSSPNLYPTGLSAILDLNESINCSNGIFDYVIRMKGHIREQAATARDIKIYIDVINQPWQDLGDTTLHEVQIFNETHFEAGPGPDLDFDVSFSGSCNIDNGNPFIVFINVITFYGNTVDQFVWIDWDEETSVKVTSVSNCTATTAKTYMVNEAISRTVEAITNNDIKFYSETFGRLDSEPYSINYNPCPGLFNITNGLNIRRKLLIDNSQPKFFITMKQWFDGLNPIWNIGLGIEPDPNRAGHNRLRFEEWRYFYQEDVAVKFPYATKITRTVDTNRLFNQLKIGYSKWQAEGTTGLFELMTKREYRVNINSVNKSLELNTDIICSPYTIEITRRKDQTTADWQYDNDIFGFCLKIVGTEYSVETFLDNATDVSNVIDPNSCYNARITPARNAMRWFDSVMQGLRNIKPDSKLIFSKGEGNYVARLMITNCNIEGKSLSESEDIDLTDFDELEAGIPITFPELITFDHPMNYNTFKRIKDDSTIRYKSFSYTCNGIEYKGWLDEIKYHPMDGMANVTLIPGNNTLPPAPPVPTCIASVSNISFNSPGDNAMTIDWDDSVPGATFWQIRLLKDGNSFLTSSYPYHPINLSGIPPGDYHVVIIPYCDPNFPGANYVEGDFNIAPSTFEVILTAMLTVGREPNNKLQLTATSNVIAPSGFSFKFGQCTFNTSTGTEACRAYPGAAIAPPSAPSGLMNFNTGDLTKMTESVYSTPGSNFGSITKIVIYDLVGITQAQITKAVGQTWTLVFL